MKKFTVLLMLICAGNLYAQTNKTITISGSLPDSMAHAYSNKPEIWFYNYFLPPMAFKSNYVTIRPLIFKDGKFKVTFVPDGDFAFFKIDGIILTTPMMDMLLVRAGSNVVFHSTGNKTGYFTGKGASVLNYQLWLAAMMHEPVPRKYNSTWDENYIGYHRTQSKKFFEISADTLQKHAEEWGQETYDLVKTYTKSCLNTEYLAILAPPSILRIDSTYRRLVLSEVTMRLNTQFQKGYHNEALLKYDFAYILYMHTALTAFFRLTMNERNPPFAYRYDYINNHFQGVLRDKLLTLEFLLDFHSPGIYDYLSKALITIKDTSSREILATEMVKIPGAKAYDFSFQDTNGRTLKLSDFKNKSVVIDLWFNGCENCIVVAKLMRPIIEHYRDSDIVFLSVNVDNTKKKFTDGVKSGLYGDKAVRYGWVGDLGLFSPLLQYYNFTAFPQLLIVDKKGIIVSINPPYPINNKTTKEWDALLHTALK
ncbi:MAG: TlpA family protein disulfide reductase [Bacteroidetes bacterium]|nr:TlpA family protein disulfide reductase [Bacteroidota bacterium]